MLHASNLQIIELSVSVAVYPHPRSVVRATAFFHIATRMDATPMPMFRTFPDPQVPDARYIHTATWRGPVKCSYLVDQRSINHLTWHTNWRFA